MFCRKCGKEIPVDAVICIGCGRAVQPVSSTLPQPDRSVKRTNPGLLLSTIIGGTILAIIGFILIATADPYSYDTDVYIILGSVLILIGYAGVIFGAVIFWIYVYRMWKMIQDGHARTTPGKAVGFSFIPFFNFYWVFQALWGWSKDYNSFIQRNAISAPRMPEGLFLTWAIIIIPASLPLINYVAGIPAIIIALICMTKMCRAVNFFANRSK